MHLFMFLVVSKVAAVNHVLINHLTMDIRQKICSTNCQTLTIHIVVILSRCTSMIIKPEIFLQQLILVGYHCTIHNI